MERQRIVMKHSPVITTLEPLSPLSLGNGEFGFSVDITGLQTFPDLYDTPLGTQSNWGWHWTNGRELFSEDEAPLQPFDSHGRSVGYPMKPEDKEEAYHWLRQNPHRLQLGRLAFRLLNDDGSEASFEDISSFTQKQNLWNGSIESYFEVDGIGVQVKTAVHPEQDRIGVHVTSSLLQQGRLQVFLRFPAPDMTHRSWDKAVALDWDNDERHRTTCQTLSTQSALLERHMDDDHYTVRLDWSTGELQQTKTHEWTLVSNEKELTLTATFAEKPPEPCHAEDVFADSETYWNTFWKDGAFVSFEGSADPRAHELERRVVLSQYLTAIHSSGSVPPQETGYMYNSWFGKSHLEMHWWHAIHFPLWGRAEKLRNSMDWYNKILPEARKLAGSQGYLGVRWPKMVGPDGKQTPSQVAPGLIWQQPHPLAMVELLYKQDSTEATLHEYKELVFESANFMADFAEWKKERGAYVLGPPLIPAQECHRMEDSINPPYELEYWAYGLRIAVQWAERLGEEPNPLWEEVASKLAPLPHQDGVYLAHEQCPTSFTEKNHDHPSMVGALGLLPGTMVDAETMRRTLIKVRDEWQWETAWGWDFPMCAMTAARLGEKQLAVDFLLMEATKNTYLPNGHNYQRPGLYAYLPGNGGLLTAVAMMSVGWEHGPGNCPGFPSEQWNVESEGLKPWL
ncbi:glycoside hydrolase family 65 [Aureibacillus halotolerans]|uniref:Glycoside hydrolase family 65 n=1 Tax=Aureibacillus halotolerans TaxID=1508390 RepID=A0A4R6TXP1_9BACI|nr:glycoside hydrolase family 65 [Aureibacillus halotolerans]TDQ38321.1 hypothetical protein EV213_11062 [Aureibacillus halotolerans]